MIKNTARKSCSGTARASVHSNHASKPSKANVNSSILDADCSNKMIDPIKTDKEDANKKSKGKPMSPICLDSSSDESYSETFAPLYDSRGIHIKTQLDLCDCITPDCPGCFDPCPKCGSAKCGHICRVNRTFMYEEKEIEGVEKVFKNVYCVNYV